MKTMIQAAAVTLIATSAVHAQQAVQWRVEDGGNGHWYHFQSASLSRDQASAAARAQGAALASITTSGENEFVKVVAAGSSCWIGGDQPLGACEPGCSWEWLDGEAWSFSRWDPATGEPNDGGGGTPGEQGLEFRPSGYWNDYWIWRNLPSVIEWSADCNDDGIVDYGQIRDGVLPDANANGVPDNCEVLRVPSDFRTIQAAVDAASDGVTVIVAPGTYAPFRFDGKRITVQASGGAGSTAIDASGQAVSAVVFGIGTSFETTLRGFTIISGNAGGGGGVLLNGDGTPAGNCDGTIEDCRFVRGAGTVGYGGGLYTEYGNVVLRRCVFDGLHAQHFHGAIGIAMTAHSSVPGLPGVSVLVEDCEIRNCSSWNSGGVGVRGLQSSKAVFRRVLFAGNSSPFSTGALISGTHDTAVTMELAVDRCVFFGNSGPYSSGISEGLPLPGELSPMIFSVSGSIFADGGTSILARGTSLLRIGDSRFCAGAGAIGSPYTDLGGNTFACEPSRDCDSDGLQDAFAIALGRVEDADENGVPDGCQGSSCADADLFRDFIVNGADLGILLSQWGPNTPLTVSDINDDGAVNGADLGLLLSFWGVCP